MKLEDSQWWWGRPTELLRMRGRRDRRTHPALSAQDRCPVPTTVVPDPARGRRTDPTVTDSPAPGANQSRPAARKPPPPPSSRSRDAHTTGPLSCFLFRLFSVWVMYKLMIPVFFQLLTTFSISGWLSWTFWNPSYLLYHLKCEAFMHNYLKHPLGIRRCKWAIYISYYCSHHACLC